MTTYDRLIFGMKCLNVSQIGSGYDGKNHYSHVSYEVDLAGMDTGADVWRNKMPNTLWYCAGAWGNAKTGNTRFFWSCDKNGKAKKVLCADGYLRYITLALTHSRRSFTVGHYYKYDEIMYQEGTSGQATGNHIHLEICAGHVRTKYRNRAGGYNLANMLPANRMMFLLNGYSYIRNGGGLLWKTTSKVPYTDSSSSSKDTFQKGYEKGKAFTTKVNLNLRSEPNTSSKVLLTIPKGKKCYYYGYYQMVNNVVWFRVSYGGKEGYIYGYKYKVDEKAPYITGLTINGKNV
mgnify:FL=1